MDQIEINPLTTKNMINISVPNGTDGNYKNGAQAFLLSNTGEHLQKFLLTAGSNDIRLKKHKPGMYLLRVETGNEVAVKQIFIQK
jgi:hypothetical protein